MLKTLFDWSWKPWCCPVLACCAITVALGLPELNAESAVSTEAGTNYTRLVSELELDELAATFSEEKVRRILGEGLLPDTKTERQAMALLHSIGAPTEASSKSLAAWAETDPVFLQTSQPAIFPEPTSKDQAVIRIEGWLREAVGAGISTGYNLIPETVWPDFDTSRTVIYGHSNFMHARQLLLLLRSEGLRPEFTFVHKKSAFRYREGWGGMQTNLIDLADGGKMVLADEYDLFLTFSSPADLPIFARLVTQYAKKDTPDEPGLIYRAWWQPFYRMFEASGEMAEARLILVRSGGYRANILSLPADAESKSAELAKRFPELHIEITPLWVNPSFFRYIQGQYK